MNKQNTNTTSFTWESEVKDSELDVQGIVNNAVYLIYLEHCRHKHLKSLGLDFIHIHRQGIDLVIRECTLKFIASLTTGDQFIVTSKCILINRAKIVMAQDIIRKHDQKRLVTATFTITGLNRTTSKIALPEKMIQIFNS